MVTSIIIFLLLGAFVGWLAGVLVRGWGFGLAGDIVVGIVGAFVGGFLYRILGFEAGGLVGQLIMATVGAVVLLLVARGIRRVAAA